MIKNTLYLKWFLISSFDSKVLLFFSCISDVTKSQKLKSSKIVNKSNFTSAQSKFGFKYTTSIDWLKVFIKVSLLRLHI